VRLDNITVRYATSIVTLTPSMAEYLNGERGITSLVHLVDNASAYPTGSHQRIKNTMVFCGNAGRLQEIPLVVSAIEGYLERGGKLSFTFLGSGTHARLFRELSDLWNNLACLGYLPLDVKFFSVFEQDSSLASWIHSGQRGLVSPPVLEFIIDIFFSMEHGKLTFSSKAKDDDTLPYYFDFFSKTLKGIITKSNST
jgi:hypothetical protein